VGGASGEDLFCDGVDCADDAEFCPAEPDTCAAVLDGRTADHKKIMAVRNVAHRLGKRCPWNQAPKLISLLDGTRPAAVVRIVQAPV
jgi:hypothetical protein